MLLGFFMLMGMRRMPSAARFDAAAGQRASACTDAGTGTDQRITTTGVGSLAPDPFLGIFAKERTFIYGIYSSLRRRR